MTLSDHEWPFYVKFKFLFLSTQVQNLLIYLYGKAIISILGVDNISGEGHMYKPKVCSVCICVQSY